MVSNSSLWPILGVTEVHATIILGLAGVGLYFFITRRYFKKSKVLFVKLHDVPDNKKLIKQTEVLISKEWPDRFADAGYDEQNFLSAGSVACSSNGLPCHLLAIRGLPGQKTEEAEVIGHVVLLKGPKTGAHDKERFARMLKVGVPPETVKKASRLMGVDISELLAKHQSGETLTIDEVSKVPQGSEKEVTVASLLVSSKYRGCGIGKALCAFAAVVAREIEADRVVGSCTQDMVPFFFHIGCHKAAAAGRKDMPKVKLGNEIYAKTDSSTLAKARQILRGNYILD